MSTLRVPGNFSWHGGQALSVRALQVAPHDFACERAPLPAPRVCPRVAPRRESSGRPACQGLARSGALGADGVCVMGLLPVECGAGTQMRCLGQELRVDVDVVRSSTHVRIVKPAQRRLSAPVPVVADHLSGGVRVVSLLAHGILIRILRGIRIDERNGVGGSIARAVVPRILGV